eukprot:COSAG01_NODE_1194_length_11305_cov_4.495806_8_plen_107_part_00
MGLRGLRRLTRDFYATASEAQLYALPADALVAAVDGGHTAEGAGKAGPDAPETAGFGFSVHKVWLPEAPPRTPVQRRRKRPSELRRLKARLTGPPVVSAMVKGAVN